jgi:hypothetical protein
MTDVLILRCEDGQARQWGQRLGLEVAISSDWELRGDHCLFVGPGIEPLWHSVQAGLEIVTTWEVAAPLWRYNVLAADVGGPGERSRTERVIRDLRVPLYAPELLFARNCEGARALIETWRAECEEGGDERLAFLRAMYRIKPRLCPLPTTWLHAVELPGAAGVSRTRQQPGAPQNLVNVEIMPGRYVRCKPGEEAAVKARFERMLAGHNGAKAVQHPPRDKQRGVEDARNKSVQVEDTPSRPETAANKGVKP